MVSIHAIELDAADPPGLLGEWLTEAGAELTVRAPHAGDALPETLDGSDALLVLGGPWQVYDDDRVPYLADVRKLLAAAVTNTLPTLAVGLGGQLLAVAAGGQIEPTDRPRLGANLTAKRDATEGDALFGSVPITPDVMQFRRHTISALPSGGRLLLNSVHDPVEAFRVGKAAWGMQFHIETDANRLRDWRGDERWGLTADDIAAAERRFGQPLDEAAFLMAQSWRTVAHQFVALVRDGIPDSPFDRTRPLLPLASND